MIEVMLTPAAVRLTADDADAKVRLACNSSLGEKHHRSWCGRHRVGWRYVASLAQCSSSRFDNGSHLSWENLLCLTTYHTKLNISTAWQWKIKRSGVCAKTTSKNRHSFKSHQTA